MSTSATDPTATSKVTAEATQPVDASPNDKGKGKSKAPKEDESMEDDDEDDEDEDDDDDDEEEEEDDEDEEDESMTEIDPSMIVGRRTRGIKVDYTSKEALEKAGLKDQKDDEDDDEEMKDN
ncbi:hypothetical protein BT96DRAFT_989914 [Gymnopus androsaceus JB14]|uniref:Histone chaperone domain-containing protein n=1 Tax=Gymnopus androsaceus JB14 TaxID=1447944 RepID=A0A6A4I0B9_9AGAR|nr:hypothetical protein BT96DRAFT_989914 [Gymnopus androsaceus JB14]